jgi:hypothetical protein
MQNSSNQDGDLRTKINERLPKINAPNINAPSNTSIRNSKYQNSESGGTIFLTAIEESSDMGTTNSTSLTLSKQQYAFLTNNVHKFSTNSCLSQGLVERTSNNNIDLNDSTDDETDAKGNILSIGRPFTCPSKFAQRFLDTHGIPPRIPTPVNSMTGSGINLNLNAPVNTSLSTLTYHSNHAIKNFIQNTSGEPLGMTSWQSQLQNVLAVWNEKKETKMVKFDESVKIVRDMISKRHEENNVYNGKKLREGEVFMCNLEQGTHEFFNIHCHQDSVGLQISINVPHGSKVTFYVSFTDQCIFHNQRQQLESNPALKVVVNNQRSFKILDVVPGCDAYISIYPHTHVHNFKIVCKNEDKMQAIEYAKKKLMRDQVNSDSVLRKLEMKIKKLLTDEEAYNEHLEKVRIIKEDAQKLLAYNIKIGKARPTRNIMQENMKLQYTKCEMLERKKSEREKVLVAESRHQQWLEAEQQERARQRLKYQQYTQQKYDHVKQHNPKKPKMTPCKRNCKQLASRAIVNEHDDINDAVIESINDFADELDTLT